jgi:hypothetical protein
MRHHRIVLTGIAVLVAGVAAHPALGSEKGKPGVAQGETSQQKSQQGIDIPESSSSNVILGGPEIIIGRIASLQGDELAIEGDRGQFMRLRVTKDTNLVCAEGQGAQMSTGRGGSKEGSEIAISGGAEKEMKRHDPGRAEGQRQALNDPNQQQAEHQMGPPTKDPSTLKDVVGSTDPKANQDVAHGSGFVVGGSSGCRFKEGDHVRVEASDMGTATTVKALSEAERSKIAGRPDEPR